MGGGRERSTAVDPLGSALREIRDELDEHLEALNENTTEIASVHEEVSDLDARLAKLAERVDALQALVLAQTRERIDVRPRVEEVPRRVVRLTANEESVVRVLASSDAPLSAVAIGQRAGLTPDLAAQVLARVVHKGVPLVVRVLEGVSVYSLAEGAASAPNKEGFLFRR